MELTNLWMLQAEYLQTRSQKALGSLYLELVEFAKILCKSRSIRNIDEVAHDSATSFIEKYLKNEDFEVVTSWSSILTYCILDTVHNKKKQKQDREEEISLDVSADEVPTWDFPVQPVRDIVEDHPSGKYILYKLYKNITVTRTIEEIQEEFGVSKRWIRDHAVQLFGVKRVLRRGGKICQKKRKDCL